MEEKYYDIIKEKLYYEKLNNGLKIFMIPRNKYNKQYGIFATNYGSIDNQFVNPENGNEITVPDGIAHFLEHKLFESKKKDTFSKFASLGSSTNAFTNYTTTAYLFSSTDKFLDSLFTLLDFVQEPYFTDENVNKEKGIIAQEIRMYEDEPNYQVYLNLLHALYHNHPVQVDIAGTIESINNITKEDLYICYNSFYNPGNMVLFLIGNFDPEVTIKKIEENQQYKNLPQSKEIKRIYSSEPKSIKQEIIEKRMNVSQPVFRLGIKETSLPENPLEMARQELATSMLLDLLIGKATVLYQSLYDDGLLDNHFNYHYVLEKGYGYILMGSKTKNPDKLYSRLLKGINNKVNNLTPDEFKRIHKKNQGEYVETFNSFQAVASEFVNYHFKDINFLELINIMQEIDFNYILQRFEELFVEKNIARSIIQEKNT